MRNTRRCTGAVTCVALLAFLALTGLAVAGRDIQSAVPLSLAVAGVACICYVVIGLAEIIIRKVEANGRRILAQTEEIKQLRHAVERINSHMRAAEYVPAVTLVDKKAS